METTGIHNVVGRRFIKPKPSRVCVPILLRECLRWNRRVEVSETNKMRIEGFFFLSFPPENAHDGSFLLSLFFSFFSASWQDLR